MQVEQAKFKTADHLFILPVILPEIETIRLFAQTLHARGNRSQGYLKGGPPLIHLRIGRVALPIRA
jgi:hypothetical protein